jgi:hypothetical protein
LPFEPVVQGSSGIVGFRISSGRAWQAPGPSRRSLTSPAARSTPRCCEIAERVTPLKLGDLGREFPAPHEPRDLSPPRFGNRFEAASTLPPTSGR